MMNGPNNKHRHRRSQSLNSREVGNVIGAERNVKLDMLANIKSYSRTASYQRWKKVECLVGNLKEKPT